jgi:hypothetical protein
MRRLVSIVLAVTWAAWFGGLLTLFLVLTSLFKTLDRTTAGQAASGVFFYFERYQLVLAAMALTLTVLWRIAGGSAALKNVLFGGFTVATLLAAWTTTQITPQVEKMRQAGETAGPQFARMHGMASMTYVGEAIVLLIVAAILVITITRDAAPAPAARKKQ